MLDGDQAALLIFLLCIIIPVLALLWKVWDVCKPCPHAHEMFDRDASGRALLRCTRCLRARLHPFYSDIQIQLDSDLDKDGGKEDHDVSGR